jgi:hypothetical protein
MRPWARTPAAGNPVYVHLAWDGGIFVIRGETGEQLWVDADGLDHELKAAKERGGVLLYSRERGDEDPPAQVEETFARIAAYELPIKLLEEPHPEALVPPERRRNVGRE